MDDINLAESVPTLDLNTIPKFTEQLVIPPVYEPEIIRCKGKITHQYTVTMSEFMEQILPSGFHSTKVWGYGGRVRLPDGTIIDDFHNSPGPTFEAIRGIPIEVQWVNNITGEHLFAVDPTIHWADPNNMGMPEPPFPPFPPGFSLAQKPVPLVTHLHGGETRSIYDGHPDTWFTAGEAITGPAFKTSRFRYDNQQNPTTLFYHDHALGITRLNVYAGLAGFYLLRDPKNKLDNIKRTPLPTGKYEIPIAIQDRSFNEDGSLFYPSEGINPDIHPYWVPEFFGNTIMVNGKVWPNLNVDRHQYRFRLVNGSEARFYNLTLSNGQSFIQIGSDGGYLSTPVQLTSLLIAPGERADILIDFSKLQPGTTIILKNDAPAPFPTGDPADPNTVGQIMQFTVTDSKSIAPKGLPKSLNFIPRLRPNRAPRILTLNEVTVNDNPVVLLLNGQPWNAPISEYPKLCTTEVWELVNLTIDAHPIHLHLVQFQILNRQAFDAAAYKDEWLRLNGNPPLDKPTITLPIEPFLQGSPSAPDKNESGWKDTVRANPGEVTRILVRFAPQSVICPFIQCRTNPYPFDPTAPNEPGYVWHCHILEHEDNEMMRPYRVIR